MESVKEAGPLARLLGPKSSARASKRDVLETRPHFFGKKFKLSFRVNQNLPLHHCSTNHAAHFMLKRKFTNIASSTTARTPPRPMSKPVRLKLLVSWSSQDLWNVIVFLWIRQGLRQSMTRVHLSIAGICKELKHHAIAVPLSQVPAREPRSVQGWTTQIG